MPTFVQSLRSSTTLQRPRGNTYLPGVLYVNFSDRGFGVIDANQNAMDLTAVRFHSTAANYEIGDHVIVSGGLYRCKTAHNAKAFDSTDWVPIAGDAHVGVMLFDPALTYPKGSFVAQDGHIYQAKADNAPGVWDATEWDIVSGTGYPAGAVPFANADGVLISDVADIHWDATAKALLVDGMKYSQGRITLAAEKPGNTVTFITFMASGALGSRVAGAEISRKGGVNGAMVIDNHGTGDLALTQHDDGKITLSTATHLRYDVTGAGQHTWYHADFTGPGAPPVEMRLVDGALQLPAGDDAARPATANLARGQVRFNTASNSFEGYDGTRWDSIGGAVETSDTAPANPSDGKLWWKSDEGQLYVYYVDANGGQWVQAGPTPPGADLTPYETIANAAATYVAKTDKATETLEGIVRITTTAEATALTDDTAALTAKKLADAFSTNRSPPIALNVYQKLPGGLIIQFGQVNITSGGYGVVKFPMTFPNKVLMTVASGILCHDNVSCWSVDPTGMTVNFPTVAIGAANWIAIGL